MKADTDNRPSWDEYFLEIAHVVATRANCLRRAVAAVIVNDNRLMSTGYNGTPRGIRNCSDGGCERCSSESPSGADLSACVCAHAEENAIAHAARYGISILGATIYVTITPCLTCARMIINSGIQEVVYESEYHFSEQTKQLLTEAGVEFRQASSRQAVK